MKTGNAAENPTALRTAESLTPEEVRAARLAVAELIFERVPDLPTALTKKRKELAERLGCSEGTLNSVTAYVRYWATQAIQETQPAVLSRDDVVSAWYYLEQTTQPDAADAWNGLDDVFQHIGGAEKGASADELKKTVEAYRRRVAAGMVRKSKTGGKKDKTTDAAPPTLAETPTVAQPVPADAADVLAAPTEETKPAAITGATFNYDNPGKNEWRDGVVMRYACDAIPETERPRANVVCFGGRKNLEPRAYIERQFSPGNILSVECDEGVMPEFLESAREAGIRTHTGELSTLRSKERFRLASLDYTGPLNLDRIFDASSILLDDDATVIINCSSKRDPLLMKAAALLQMGIINTSSAADLSKDIVMPDERSVSDVITEAIEEAPDTQLGPDQWARHRRRLIMATLWSFGMARRESVSMQGFPNLERVFLMPDDMGLRIGDAPPKDEMGGLLARFGDEYCAAYGQFTRVPAPPLIRNMTMSMIMGTKMAFTSRPLISNLHHEKYYSEHDGKRNPFITACARLRVPRAFYKKRHATFLGMARILEAMLQDTEGLGRLHMKVATVKGQGLASVMTKQVVQMAFRTPKGSFGDIDIKELQDTFTELRGMQQEQVCYMLDEDTDAVDANGIAKAAGIDAAMAEHAEKVKAKTIRRMNKVQQPKYRRY